MCVTYVYVLYLVTVFVFAFPRLPIHTYTHGTHESTWRGMTAWHATDTHVKRERLFMFSVTNVCSCSFFHVYVCLCVFVCVCVFHVSLGYLAMTDNRREAKESHLADMVDLSFYDQLSRGCIRAVPHFVIQFFPLQW